MGKYEIDSEEKGVKEVYFLMRESSEASDMQFMRDLNRLNDGVSINAVVTSKDRIYPLVQGLCRKINVNFLQVKDLTEFTDGILNRGLCQYPVLAYLSENDKPEDIRKAKNSLEKYVAVEVRERED